MEKNEPNMNAYTDVIMKKAHLDWEMECLQTKIKCKYEENSKLENQIAERKNELEKLKKNVSASCDREEKVKNNINMLRNSRTISEGLLMSMKHQLRILEEKSNDTKKIRKNILEKYSTLFESHKKIYSSLPWVKKINELKMSVKNKQIHLDILKLEYSSIKRKIRLFNIIQDQRKTVAIIKLAKGLVERNNLKKEVEYLFNKQKEFQSRIMQLNEDKIKLQEKIDLKVKDALDEARGRVVKKHVGGSNTENHTAATSNPDTMKPLGINLKPTSESIFSRLGLSVPPSMKRLLTSSRVLFNRENGLLEEHNATGKDIPANEIMSTVHEKSFTLEVQRDKQTKPERMRVLDAMQGQKEEHTKKKGDPATEKINRVEEIALESDKSINQNKHVEKASVSQAVKRSSNTLPNISEKRPHLMEPAQSNDAPLEENNCLAQDGALSSNISSYKEKGTNNETSEVTLPVTACEPEISNEMTVHPDENINKRSSENNVRSILKNKGQKDNKSESTLSVQASESSKSYITPANIQNAIVHQKSSRGDQNESTDILPEKQTMVVDSTQEITLQKDIEPEKQVTRHMDSQDELAHEKNIMSEVEMNDSNLSMLDNISVISSTFTSDNRNQMAKSPDFLTQIPQSYCFSPLYSPSKADSVSEISSNKGGKSPSNIPITSMASPLFPMDTQPTVGPSSDFSSFFGSSPKKTEKSSKNFFQLFG